MLYKSVRLQLRFTEIQILQHLGNGVGVSRRSRMMAVAAAVVMWYWMQLWSSRPFQCREIRTGERGGKESLSDVFFSDLGSEEQ